MRRYVQAICGACVVLALWGVLIAHWIDRKNARTKAEHMKRVREAAVISLALEGPKR